MDTVPRSLHMASYDNAWAPTFSPIPLWTKHLNKMDAAGLLTLFREHLWERVQRTNPASGEAPAVHSTVSHSRPHCSRHRHRPPPPPPPLCPPPLPITNLPSSAVGLRDLSSQVSQQLLVAGNALQQVASLRLQLRAAPGTHTWQQSLMYLYSVTGDALQQVASLGLQLRPLLNTYMTQSLMYLYSVTGDCSLQQVASLGLPAAGPPPEHIHDTVINVFVQCHWWCSPAGCVSGSPAAAAPEHIHNTVINVSVQCHWWCSPAGCVFWGLQLRPFPNTHITWSLSMFLHNVAGNARRIFASLAAAVPENWGCSMLHGPCQCFLHSVANSALQQGCHLCICLQLGPSLNTHTTQSFSSVSARCRWL